MTFLPIVERELRVAARRRLTFWGRLLAGLLAILLGVLVYLMGQHESPHEVGLYLFRTVAGLAMFLCAIGGATATADCLSEEKREGTLGLLFLTDLKGYDVVLGKLVASSLGVFYSLLAVLPVMAIPLLLGGVTNGEFWRMSLGLLVVLLFSLAVGMFASAISRGAREAMGGAYALILVFGVMLPLLGFWMSSNQKWKWLGDCFHFTSPISIFVSSMDSQFPMVSPREQFWWSIGVTHALTWMLLLLACWIVPRTWQDRSGAKARPLRERLRRLNYGDDVERRALRKQLLDINAFYWLAGRARTSPAAVWSFLAVAACLWTWGAVKFGRDWFDSATYLFTAYVLNAVLKTWVAGVAGQRFGEDKKSGALELILSTPMRVPEILHGQWLALRRQFLGPLAAVIVVETIFAAATLRKQEEAEVFPLLVCFIILLVTDVAALGWAGMWSGLTARTPNRALGNTAARVLVLPNGLFFAALIATVLWQEFTRYYGSGSDTGKFYLGLWFGLGILADILFGVGAWRRLHAEFRQRAVERYAPREKRSWFNVLLPKRLQNITQV